jgi:predicted enzyme related to lactoylglutathione lyase
MEHSMSDTPDADIGRIAWTDLTVDDAETVRDFYAAVAGWTFADVDMGEYADFNMLGGDGTPVAGICHARGGNAGLPPVWMVYITVHDLDESLSACRARGGTVIGEPRAVGDAGRFAIIRDPAGAVAALYEVPPQA